MEIMPLEKIVHRWTHRGASGYVDAYVGGGPTGIEIRDRKWILGSLRRFTDDEVREAIMQARGRGNRERWLTLASAFGVSDTRAN
jgi:hypothetical protein